MNETPDNEYNIDENLVKEALVSIVQNRALELTSQNLLLQANYQVLLQECQNFPSVLQENKNLKEQLQLLTKKTAEEVQNVLDEKIRIEATHEHAISDQVDMINKIDTFYKPRIRELEKEIEKMKKPVSEKKQSEAKFTEK